MCGHPLQPITDEEIAGIRGTYERGGAAALGFSQVARLLDKIDRLREEARVLGLERGALRGTLDRCRSDREKLLATTEQQREQLAAATARAETAEAAYHRLDSEQAAAGSYAGRAEAAEAALAEQRETIAAQIADLGESRARNAHTTGPLAVVDRVQADTYRTAAWLIRNPDQFGKRDATPHAALEQQAAEQGDEEGGDRG